MTQTEPLIKSIRKTRGVAGEYALTATVQYPDEPACEITFQGSVYGPPIVMVTEGLPRGVFVSQRVTDRVGSTLDERWVRRFFGQED